MHLLLIVPSQPDPRLRRGGWVERYGAELRRRLPIPVRYLVARGSSGAIPLSQRALRTLRRAEKGAGKVVQVENRPALVPLVRHALHHTPICLNLHSTTFLRPPRLRATVAGRALKRTDRIVCNSHFLARTLARRHPSIADRLRVIWPGVDPHQFRPVWEKGATRSRRRWRRRLGLEGHWVVLWIGRVVPQKGLHILIEALQRVARALPSPALLIAGRPVPSATARSAYARRLAAHLARLPFPVRLAGHLPPYRVPRVYWAADLLAFPAQGEEGFGLVSIEALATGLPVIASAAGGIPEALAGGEWGRLVSPPASVRAWSHALVEAARRPRPREEAAAIRQAAIDRYSWDRVAREWLALYDELTVRKGS